MKKFLSRIFKKKTSEPEVVKTPKQEYDLERYRTTKSMVDKWILHHKDVLAKEIIEDVRNTNNEILHSNGNCPVCKGTTIVSKYLNDKSGIVRFCHCNGCGHEWKYLDVKECKYPQNEAWSDMLHEVCYFLDSLGCISYRRPDTEHLWEYDCVEEWEEDEFKDVYERFSKILATYPYEVIYHFTVLGCNSYLNWSEEIFGRMGYISFNDYQEYVGSFTPLIEDYLKRLGVKSIKEHNIYGE
jgi:DNA-directed RNA polymerase subunit M/transcription elongation factor TFIIS